MDTRCAYEQANILSNASKLVKITINFFDFFVLVSFVNIFRLLLLYLLIGEGENDTTLVATYLLS